MRIRSIGIAVALGTALAQAPGAAAAPDAPSSRIHGDAARGIAIPVPAGWRIAQRPLTPHLSDPHELVSLGTGPMPVAARACAHMPGRAIDRAAPAGAFVSLLERSGTGAGATGGSAGDDPLRGYPPRPARWRLVPARAAEGFACVTDRRVRVWWRPFRQSGRAFYLLVAIGRDAPPARRAEALAVANGLRIARGTTVGGGPWLRIPHAWHARASARRGAQSLVVSTVPIGDGDGDDAERTQARLGPGDLTLTVTRFFRPRRRPAGARVSTPPLRFAPEDFRDGPYEGQRAAAFAPRRVVVRGQLLRVTLALGPAPTPGGPGVGEQRLPADADALTRRANRVLATLLLAPL
ncbi:MAG: hypothetical protein AB7V42_02865 [Thermoleophilia bacterium]